MFHISQPYQPYPGLMPLLGIQMTENGFTTVPLPPPLQPLPMEQIMRQLYTQQESLLNYEATCSYLSEQLEVEKKNSILQTGSREKSLLAKIDELQKQLTNVNAKLCSVTNEKNLKETALSHEQEKNRANEAEIEKLIVQVKKLTNENIKRANVLDQDLNTIQDFTKRINEAVDKNQKLVQQNISLEAKNKKLTETVKQNESELQKLRIQNKTDRKTIEKFESEEKVLHKTLEEKNAEHMTLLNHITNLMPDKYFDLTLDIDYLRQNDKEYCKFLKNRMNDKQLSSEQTAYLKRSISIIEARIGSGSNILRECLEENVDLKAKIEYLKAQITRQSSMFEPAQRTQSSHFINLYNDCLNMACEKMHQISADYLKLKIKHQALLDKSEFAKLQNDIYRRILASTRSGQEIVKLYKAAETIMSHEKMHNIYVPLPPKNKNEIRDIEVLMKRLTDLQI
jgi:hypothetical protein